MICSYPHCPGLGESVNVFGTKGGFANLCRAHATAWDLLASAQNTTGKAGRKRLEKMFRDWIEHPALVNRGDDGITEI